MKWDDGVMGLYGGTDGDDGNRDWLMEMDCSGYDFYETGGLVVGAVIAREVFSDRIRQDRDGGRDFVTSLSLEDIDRAKAAAFSEMEGCGTMAGVVGKRVGPGEFSGDAGIKGRPLTMDAHPLDSEHANLERHHAAFATNPADPTSGEAQGDANRS